MTDLNSIFVSNLSEEEKKAKSIFGKLLISLRRSNHMRLYSLLGSVVDTTYGDNVIKLILSDKTSYEMINNQTDINTINQTLNEIEEGLRCEFGCEEKVEFNAFKFKEFLKKEFDKILTIK